MESESSTGAQSSVGHTGAFVGASVVCLPGGSRRGAQLVSRCAALHRPSRCHARYPALRGPLLAPRVATARSRAFLPSGCSRTAEATLSAHTGCAQHRDPAVGMLADIDSHPTRLPAVGVRAVSSPGNRRDVRFAVGIAAARRRQARGLGGARHSTHTPSKRAIHADAVEGNRRFCPMKSPLNLSCENRHVDQGPTVRPTTEGKPQGS